MIPSKPHWIDNNLHGYKWCFICSSCGYVDGFPFNDRLPQCPCCKATIPSAGGILRKYFDKSGYRQYMAALWNRRVNNG